jgi:tetratricopeptide (TPR) repeat protein
MTSQGGDEQEAIHYYLQGLVIDQNDYDLLYNIGCLYNKNNDLHSALYYFCRAYLSKLKVYQPGFALAVVLYRLGVHDESLEFATE